VTIYRLGSTTVNATDAGTAIAIDDVGAVYASLDEQPGQAEIAAKIGMTPRAMNRGHDVAHVLLAHLLRQRHSPGLAVAARGERGRPVDGLEEAAVLAIQAYAHAAGIDLVRVLAETAGALRAHWRAGYAMGHDETVKTNDEVREELRAEISPLPDAELAGVMRRYADTLQEIGERNAAHHYEDVAKAGRERLEWANNIRKAADTLSRPAPGWDEACQAIEQQIRASKGDALTQARMHGAWDRGRVSGIDEAAAIARGLKKGGNRS